MSQITDILPRPNFSKHLSYGWVIVISCTLMMAITYGLMYSYSVFFKPLAEHFQWDRATVSLVYSVSLVIRGGVSIGIGWLADKYGARKLMVFCGIMMALGLVLSSQVHSLWQFFLTYSLVEAIGLSGTFGIATAVTSRWFTKNRGLALGIVSSGVGLGTLLIVPGAERLIEAVQWSNAYIIYGSLSGVLMVISAFFLKAPPTSSENGESTQIKDESQTTGHDLNLKQAIVNPLMILVIVIFALLFFSTQMVIVHLVNYATDLGINSLTAAALISIIGVISIIGRLTLGISSDKLGIYNTLILVCGLLVVSLVILLFTRTLWSFYLFATVFGFSYGGEVPQIPLFVGKFCGTKSMATLMGLTLFVGNIGGALGPWVGGKIFDMTSHYQGAFSIAAAACLGAFIIAFILKKRGGLKVKG